MGIWSLLFDKKRRVNRRPASKPSRRQPSTRAALHRELVSVALRDTLIRHGIPTGWVSVDTQSAIGARGEPHCHVRLLLRHWDPRLMEHAVAFQKSFASRISLLDANQHAWLRGISWQFAMPDEETRQQMPPPATWKPAPKAAAPVVAAPVQVQHSQLEQLRRMMADGDAFHAGEGDDGPADFQNTQPFDAMDGESPAIGRAH